MILDLRMTGTRVGIQCNDSCAVHQHNAVFTILASLCGYETISVPNVLFITVGI